MDSNNDTNSDISLAGGMSHWDVENISVDMSFLVYFCVICALQFWFKNFIETKKKIFRVQHSISMVISFVVVFGPCSEFDEIECAVLNTLLEC